MYDFGDSLQMKCLGDKTTGGFFQLDKVPHGEKIKMGLYVCHYLSDILRIYVKDVVVRSITKLHINLSTITSTGNTTLD